MAFLLISASATEWVVWNYAAAQVEARAPGALGSVGTIFLVEADFTARGLVFFTPPFPLGGEE